MILYILNLFYKMNTLIMLHIIAFIHFIYIHSMFICINVCICLCDYIFIILFKIRINITFEIIYHQIHVNVYNIILCYISKMYILNTYVFNWELIRIVIINM